MSVSVIIVSWNSSECICECLASIDKKYEIIVVDNHSQDGTVEKIKQNFIYVKLLENKYNAGLSRAINQGAKLANEKYLLILNPDVILMERTIDKLLDFMEKNQEVGACSPRFFYPNGTIQRSCRKLPTFFNLFLEYSGIGRILKIDSWKFHSFSYDKISEVEQPMGSCLLLRKDVFCKVGGMDESYPIFMNDVELCYKIKKLGYKIYFVPEANVIHYLGWSTRKVKSKMIIEEHRCVYKYLKNHYKHHFLLPFYGFILFSSAFYRVIFNFFLKKLMSIKFLLKIYYFKYII